jgi:hypothetical protein
MPGLAVLAPLLAIIYDLMGPSNLSSHGDIMVEMS